jgi:hypothetical protein
MHIAEIVNKAARKPVSIEEIVERFRKEHPQIIREETDALVDSALRRIANEICNLSSGRPDIKQLELFGEYGVSRTVKIILPDKGGAMRPVRVRLDALTLEQADQYIAEHSQLRKPSKRIIEMERLLKDVRPFDTGGSSVGDCWKASRTAKAADTGS